MNPTLELLLIKCYQYVVTIAIGVLIIISRLFKGGYTNEHPKPKCLKGWNDKYIQLSQVKLHYVQTGEDDKPLMLMIHGFPEFWYSYRYQLRHFKDSYRCVAYDQRGYNLSDKPAEIVDYKIDFLVNDAKELIEKLGYKRAVVVGHDWGAIVAWTLAIRYPEVVEKLVILNVPHPVAFENALKYNVKQTLSSWYMFLFQTPRVPEVGIALYDYLMLVFMFRGIPYGIKNHKNFTDDDMEAWKHVFSQPGALTPPINYYRNVFNEESLNMNKGRMTCEVQTLIIWGTDDRALIKESAADSLKYCTNGQLTFIEGASHWVMQDAPERVNKRIDDFMHETVVD